LTALHGRGFAEQKKQQLAQQEQQKQLAQQVQAAQLAWRA